MGASLSRESTGAWRDARRGGAVAAAAEAAVAAELSLTSLPEARRQGGGVGTEPGWKVSVTGSSAGADEAASGRGRGTGLGVSGRANTAVSCAAGGEALDPFEVAAASADDAAEPAEPDGDEDDEDGTDDTPDPLDAVPPAAADAVVAPFAGVVRSSAISAASDGTSAAPSVGSGGTSVRSEPSVATGPFGPGVVDGFSSLSLTR